MCAVAIILAHTITVITYSVKVKDYKYQWQLYDVQLCLDSGVASYTLYYIINLQH